MDEKLHPPSATPAVSSNGKPGTRAQEQPDTPSLTDRVIAFVDSQLQSQSDGDDWRKRIAG